ncbi:MAG: NUDIX hydrolase [Alphaproteobacteria bacterium]|nr:NUDIX hydrolase [Alphaproteobacteria bacterium]MCA0245758.1 NUDIX hydrolase [Pseudomonadota bacterium]MCA0449327.1 NUDIX hydrolase [Pseudomonadota bacterium]
MTVREDQVRFPDGSLGIYGVAEKKDCIGILAIDDGHIHLVEQYRYATSKRAWELPQGSWEAEDLDPEALAKRELAEETGLTARTWKFLGTLAIANGFLRQSMHVYLATDLTQGVHSRDSTESDMVHARVPLAEFERMMTDGRVDDAETLAIWALAKLKGAV